MFLQELNDKQKKDFLELAYYTINIDGIVDTQEHNMFNNFRAEVSLSEDEYTIQNKSIKEIITNFSASKKRIKKVVLMELFGIILSNKEFHSKEQELIEVLRKEWNFREYEIKKIKRWVEDFTDMIQEAYIFIGE